jgi:hypothetical protein
MKRLAALLASLLLSGIVHAQQQQAVALPALDEGGLIVMIALVGVVGGIVARRRRK